MPRVDGVGSMPGRYGGWACEQAQGMVGQVMRTLALLALPLVLLVGPDVFALALGAQWRNAGALVRVRAPYIGVHFIASPLAAGTQPWDAQSRAFRLALLGKATFLGALALGSHFGGVVGGACGVSGAMVLYFGWYFWSLATWRDIRDVSAA